MFAALPFVFLDDLVQMNIDPILPAVVSFMQIL